ncbi:hypothetical protein D0860_01578 [Hortaea werneckii]|uniref:Uncharacterized protein n=1 Tax=Hortaea werneckii TaxID=91943 RepID=A0A3M7HQE4_HORWE|nr:hypothetical protein D0860_01578 [Hortaea werneckii]
MSTHSPSTPPTFPTLLSHLLTTYSAPVLPSPSPFPHNPSLNHPITTLSLHPTLEALLHILNSDLASAHFLVRKMQAPPAYEGMLIHAVLHRVEGDYHTDNHSPYPPFAMLPTINSSRSNRPPSHPNPPPRRKPSASEVLSLVAAKYAELFHYLHTVPPPAASPSTPSDSSSPPSATLSPPTADISNAIFQDHDDDHRDNKINGSSQTSLPAAQQTQALLTPHELAAIHHAAAWSLAQQPHLLLEAREQRRTDNSSGLRVKRQSHPEPNDERVANGDLGAGKGEGGSDDGEREFSRLLRRELEALDNSPFPSTSVPIASTAATPRQIPPPPCDPYHHTTSDPAGPGSSDHKSDDDAWKNDPVANPEGEEKAEDAAKTAKEDHDQHDYNQAFTAVLERTHIDYLALKGLVRTWYNRWQELRNSSYRGNEHDERELQRLSALLAEARPLIAQWKSEDATVRERDRKRRREDGWDAPTNAWTVGMEQDTIGFGSPIQHSQPKRLLWEPLSAQEGEGNSTTPSWSALSSAFGRAPAQQQYQHHPQHQHQYPHQHQPSPQQHPHQSFSHSFVIPTTQYHQAQRQPEPQQHKRIDSYEILANNSLSHHANHFSMTPSPQTYPPPA